jgi:hypothetical protein
MIQDQSFDMWLEANDIHKAVLYGIIGGALIGVQYTYKIYFKIIKKMRDYIEEAERRNNS